MNLKTGHLLKRGEYRVEKELGQGGFGITYLAEQTGLARRVAIKEFFMREYCEREHETASITLGSSGSREMVERFRQKFIKEARAIAAFGFDNKHIVRIIDVFEENNTAYYVMEYVGGGSLSDKVKTGALPEAAAVRYIRQIASALDFVHGKHMMHLDVKPSNILLNENDETVLIDFGLAKQYDTQGSQTSTTPVGISHGYAPLEQYRQGGVGTFSPATDIYSLGATLYKLLTGETPPEAGDVMNEGLPELPVGISSNVRKAIETAMQPAVRKRPQSISEFLSLLEGNVKAESGKVKTESNDDGATEILHSVQDDKYRENSSSTPGGEVSRSDGGENVGKSKDERAKSKDESDGAIEILRSAQNDKKRADNTPKRPFNKLFAIIPVVAICIVAAILFLVALFFVKSCNGQAEQERKEIGRRTQEQTDSIAAEQQSQEAKTINGHEYVDLGLPSGTKWATCNVGASSPEEYGGYYAWGETEEKGDYNWKTYKWCKGADYAMTKYRNRTSSSYDKTTLDPEDDVAYVKWGGTWRIPTKNEQEELLNNCKWEWITVNSINGYKVTGPNGNSIFLPAAGYRDGTDFDSSGYYGNYWSSSLDDDAIYSDFAYNSLFYSDNQVRVNRRRYYGLSVRPVSE